MSVFSEVLSRFTQAQHVNTMRLAEYCKLERSTFYKFLKGDRTPGSAELVNKIAHFSQLSPSETKELFSTWQIVRTGEETWYSRKSVENFLLNFPTETAGQPDLVPSLTAGEDSASEEDCTALTEPQNIDRCVHRMLLLEFQKEAGTVELLLQPDYVFLFSLLATLRPAGTMQVRNIFCLDDKTSMKQTHEVRSLTYLHMMIPLYMNELDYTPFYFYGSIDGHYNDLNLLPCMVLTSDAVLLFSADRRNGFFCRKPSVVQMLHAQFQGYQEQCTPFLYTSKLDPDTYVETLRPLFASKTRKNVFTFTPEGCLCPFLTNEIAEESLNRSLPDVDAVRRIIAAVVYYDQASIDRGWLRAYLTEEGLSHFAESGRIAEIPEVFYNPLSVPNRIRILQRVRAQCLSGAYCMLKSPLNHLTKNLNLVIWGETQLMGTLSSRPRQNSMFFIFIQEEGQLRAFWDYLSSLDEDVLYTNEEATEKVDFFLRLLQERAASPAQM